MENKPDYKTLKEFTDDYVWDDRDPNAKLGEGGFGKVWKAYHETQNEYVAIKVSDFAPHRPSLMDEVQTAKTLPKHSNIVYYDSCHRFNIKGSGAWDYAVMKYYEDGNLSQLLERTQLPADDRKHLILSAEYRDKLILGLLAGIAHLHKHNIVHRDLKPGNVLIAKHPKGWFVPKITDFGLSKVVSDDQFIKSTIFNNTILGGSPAYQAPEQLEESEMRFNVDLWAFGVILYEIMTGGENPFNYRTTDNSGYPSKSVLSHRITSVILPERLATIEEPYQTMIRRCLVKNIHKRVKSAAELFDIKDGVPSKMAALKKAIEEKSYRHALDLAEKLLNLRPQNEQVLEWKQQCEEALKKEAQLIEKAKEMLNKEQYESVIQQSKKYILEFPKNKEFVKFMEQGQKAIELLAIQKQEEEIERKKSTELPTILVNNDAMTADTQTNNNQVRELDEGEFPIKIRKRIAVRVILGFIGLILSSISIIFLFSITRNDNPIFISIFIILFFGLCGFLLLRYIISPLLYIDHECVMFDSTKIYWSEIKEIVILNDNIRFAVIVKRPDLVINRHSFLQRINLRFVQKNYKAILVRPIKLYDQLIFDKLIKYYHSLNESKTKTQLDDKPLKDIENGVNNVGCIGQIAGILLGIMTIVRFLNYQGWNEDKKEPLLKSPSNYSTLCQENLASARQDLANGTNPDVVMAEMRGIIKDCGVGYKDSTAQIFLDRAESFRGLSDVQFERFKSYADSLKKE